jgi:phage terminase large subunit
MSEWSKESLDILMAERAKRYADLTLHPELQKYEIALCKRDFFHWMKYWVFTYNPQNVGTEFSPWLPFVPFERQKQLIEFFDAKLKAQEDGLIVKSREIGYSWLTITWTAHKWLWLDGFIGSFTANLEANVDRIGDPKSLFEKVRQLLSTLPIWMKPSGFRQELHANYMKIINPENGNVISGASGEQAGRGGRSTIFFIDEAAFIDAADRIDAATAANARCRIWGSTVNGMGNLFARKRFGGQLKPNQIFHFHWKSDPRKDSVWEIRERTRLEPHVWASEYDHDFTASVEGICIPSKWVNAAKDIKNLIKIIPAQEGISGGDVGGGKAKSTVVTRFGPVVTLPSAWSDPDTIETAFRMLDAVEKTKINSPSGNAVYASTVLYFDCVAIGHGVMDVLARNERNDIMTIPVNTGDPPSETTWEDGKTSKQKFVNLKAELWFLLRQVFKNTYEHWLFLRKELGGIEHDQTELISLPNDEDGPEAIQLSAELSLPKWMRNENGKIMLERKGAMAKRGIPSTDYADSLVLTFAGNTSLEVWAKLGENRGTIN